MRGISDSMPQPAQASTPYFQGNGAFRDRVRQFVEALQDKICAALEQLEGGSPFAETKWEQPAHAKTKGGGRSRVLEGGAVVERGAVHTSAVYGLLPESMAAKFNVAPQDFFATGVSLIIHPRNPHAPTVHANYRYFEMSSGDFWFGGGTDLTPYYLYPEDVRHFHKSLKQACDKHDSTYYARFKKWCDEYFYLPHRGETRGVGGIFYDYVRGDSEKLFAFMQTIGSSFIEAYLPILKKRKDSAYDELQRAWQELRRGRYVEFNLLYDRGTKFGLETGGRTESILASLPPVVQWRYDYSPVPGSPEAELLLHLKPIDWLGIEAAHAG